MMVSKYLKTIPVKNYQKPSAVVYIQTQDIATLPRY